eukprot:3565140-Rhodomonas_salina.2
MDELVGRCVALEGSGAGHGQSISHPSHHSHCISAIASAPLHQRHCISAVTSQPPSYRSHCITARSRARADATRSGAHAALR